MGLGLGGLQSGGGSVDASSVIPALVGQDIVARSISLTQAPGGVAVQLVAFAKVDFGGTGTDFLDSDGTSTVRAGGLFSSDGDMTVGTGGSGDLIIRRHFTRAAGRLLFSATAPTISSGFGTSPSIVANNGSYVFTINVGTGGIATTGVIGLPTSTTGWAVHVANITNPAASIVSQTATTTATASIANYSRTTGLAAAWAASDILICIAAPY